MRWNYERTIVLLLAACMCKMVAVQEISSLLRLEAHLSEISERGKKVLDYELFQKNALGMMDNYEEDLDAAFKLGMSCPSVVQSDFVSKKDFIDCFIKDVIVTDPRSKKNVSLYQENLYDAKGDLIQQVLLQFNTQSQQKLL